MTVADFSLEGARGFVAVGIGPRILRTETAAPALLAIVQSRYGDLASRGAAPPAS